MKKLSFTLIETIVVIAIIALVMPGLFVIVTGLMKEQIRVERLSITKTEGDHVLSSIANTIRDNGYEIFAGTLSSPGALVCLGAGGSRSYPLFFKDYYDSPFEFVATSGQISSMSATTQIPLNSSQTAISNFSISCIKGSRFAPSVVSLSYDICFSRNGTDCSSADSSENASRHYQTKIQLRNF